MEKSNLNIEQTLKEVKEGIVNNTMTKEQAELLIKKCDILIKKNKKNLEMQAQIANKEECKEDKKEVKFQYWEDELVDTLMFRDEREGGEVRQTISSWFATKVEEIEEGVYFTESDTCPTALYYFDEDDSLVGMALLHEGEYSAESVEEELDEYFKRKHDRWFDRRSGFTVKVHKTGRGTWLVQELEEGCCRYAADIRKYEKKLK